MNNPFIGVENDPFGHAADFTDGAMSILTATGATLHTAAVELLKAKPASITVLTLARTPSHAGF